MSRGVCVDCHERRTLVARRLCSACYGWHRLHRTLDTLFPVAARSSLYCECPSYVPQRIPMFQTDQCTFCGRPARPLAVS